MICLTLLRFNQVFTLHLVHTFHDYSTYFPAYKNYLFYCLLCLNREREFEHVKKTVAKELEICGFIDIKDIANPPYLSRHLVLPLPVTGSPVKSEAHGVGNTFVHCILGNIAQNRPLCE